MLLVLAGVIGVSMLWDKIKGVASTGSRRNKEEDSEEYIPVSDDEFIKIDDEVIGVTSASTNDLTVIRGILVKKSSK